MSLDFKEYLDTTKSEISYENEWTSNEIISIQTDESVDYNYSSIDDFFSALNITNETITITNNDELTAIQEKIEELKDNCNFVLEDYSINTVVTSTYTITSHVYTYSYKVLTSLINYGDKTTIYYLNLNATADQGEDNNGIQITNGESSVVINAQEMQSSLQLVLILNEEVENENPEEPQEVEITDSEYGSFPSGTSAEYCVLLLHADEDYIQTRGVTQVDLDSWAIDYLSKLNEYGLDSDKDQYEIATSYYGYDSTTEQYYVLVEKESADSELVDEWSELYETDYDLQNEVIQSNGRDCYKVYVTGWCQIVNFDDATLISDQGGSTERRFYSYPNGYYVLIGDKLRLFILDKIAKIDYELNADSCTWYPVTSPNNGETLTLSSRTEYQNGNYYFYIGTRASNAGNINFPLEHSDTTPILQYASNLRMILVSNSVLEMETFSGIANPTNGILLSNNLTAIGRYMIDASSNSVVKIFSRAIEYIGEQAFPATANVQIIMCEENEYDIVSLNTNSYIDLPATVTYIDTKAFYGLSIGILNALKCSSLFYVGALAFAAASTLKIIYLNYNTLDINDTGKLIYLPDSIEYKIGTQTANFSYYNSSGSNSDKANSETQMTLGTSLSGYTIEIE